MTRLTASNHSRFSLPDHDRCVGKPNRQAAALPQSCIVSRRVRRAMLLLGDVMTAFGVDFERHDTNPTSSKEQPRCHPSPDNATAVMSIARFPMKTTRAEPLESIELHWP